MRAPGQSGQSDDDRGGGDTSAGYHRQPGPDADPCVRKSCAGKRERRQGGAVDQAEHDKGKAERANACRATWKAADDGDPHGVVEATWQHYTDEGGTAVAGEKRKWPRPLGRQEQPAPAHGLQTLREDQKQPRGYQHAGASA